MSETVKHAVIICHPAQDSFTRSVADTYAEAVRAHGQEVVLRDLYRIGFDPVLREEEREGQFGADVAAEWDLIGDAQFIVLAYPVWFGAPPAMMVGYIDRVFGAGRQLGLGGEAGPGSRLEGKRLVSLTSSGSMRAWLNERGVMMSLRSVYDRYLAEVFGFVETARYHLDGIGPDLPERDAQQHLHTVTQAAREVMSRQARKWEPPAI